MTFIFMAAPGAATLPSSVPKETTTADGRFKREKHMPNRRLALLLAPCLLSAGCVVSIPSAPGADHVALTHKDADVASCTVLGEVIGLTDTNYVRDERREMQNQAVGLGADTILLTRDRDPPKGTAYRCKPSTTKGSH
jgi:hypothetical protein